MARLDSLPSRISTIGVYYWLGRRSLAPVSRYNNTPSPPTMNPSDPSNHWDDLASNLGAAPSEAPEVPQPEPVEAEIVPPADPPPPRRANPPRPSTVPESDGWNSVLEDLGLEAPAASPPEKPSIDLVTSLRKNPDTIETGEDLLTEVSWETQADIADDNGESEIEDLGDSVIVVSEENDDPKLVAPTDDANSEPERGKRRRGRRGRGRGRGRGKKESESPSTATSDESPETEEGDSVGRESEPPDESSGETEETSQKPRRRRRRGRGRGSRSEGESAPSPESEESPSDALLEDQDLSDEIHDDSEDEEDRRPRHRSVPTWLDAITTVIDKNIESHSKSGSSSRGGGRRGGRGRGRRGGSSTKK